jgi:NAD(P)H dehydrogenase (quinone)
MKIGISGASGRLGAATIRYLRARVPAERIVGISRSPDQVAALGVEARFGDFDEPASLEHAYAGIDRLLIIPGPDMRPGVRGTQVCDAIERAGRARVGHVVLLSALGTRAAERGKLWESCFGPEQALMSSSLAWTIVRAAYYAESFVEEIEMSVSHGIHASLAPTPVNFVSRDDLAQAAAALLAGGGHHGAIVHATGPAALDGPTRAKIVADALEIPFAFVAVTVQQYIEGLKAVGVSESEFGGLVSVQEMWACGGFDVTTGDIERLTGTRPRTLAEVLAQELGHDIVP